MAGDELALYAGWAAVNLVYGHDEEVARWVAQHIPDVGNKGFGPCMAIGVATDRLIAGMVYHDMQEMMRDGSPFRTIQLSMAAETPIWARRDVIKALLHYPFEQLGVWLVWTATAIDNARALKVNEHIGFVREAVLADRFGPKKHAVICRMKRADYVRLWCGGREPTFDHV